MRSIALIPARLESTRLSRKLLRELNGIPLIVRTAQNITDFKIFDEVHVITDSIDIKNILDKYSISNFLSEKDHQTGTDRVYEVFKSHLNSEPNLIVNLQGDMPNIGPQAISDLINYMQQGNCDIGTLASSFSSDGELADENNVKVAVKGQLFSGKFSEAIDFFRIDLSLIHI